MSAGGASTYELVKLVEQPPQLRPRFAQLGKDYADALPLKQKPVCLGDQPRKLVTRQAATRARAPTEDLELRSGEPSIRHRTSTVSNVCSI